MNIYRVWMRDGASWDVEATSAEEAEECAIREAECATGDAVMSSKERRRARTVDSSAHTQIVDTAQEAAEAAGPDLLAACKAMLGWMTDPIIAETMPLDDPETRPYWAVVEAARIAIAKAEN